MTTPNQVVSFFGTQGLTSETLYMNLFTNDATIGAGTVSGSLTVASGGGYAEKTLAGTSWTGTVASADHCTVSLPEQTFTFTGSVGVVYGWAITEGAGLTGDLVAVGKFNQGQMIGDNGDAIAITLGGDVQIGSGTWWGANDVMAEDFEGSGTCGDDNAGNANCRVSWVGNASDQISNIATGLEGSYAKYINPSAGASVSTYTTLPGATTYYGFLRLKLSLFSRISGYGGTFMSLYSSGGTLLTGFSVTNVGGTLYWRITPVGGTAADASSPAPVGGSSYYIWWRFTRGVTSTSELWVSTTATKPGSATVTATGSIDFAIGRLQLQGVGSDTYGYAKYTFDKIRVGTGAFGDDT